MTLLPTPRTGDGTKGGPNQRGSSGDLMLPSAVASLLPTPSVADSMGGHRSRSGDRGDELLLPGLVIAQARGELLPTPVVTDAHAGAPADLNRKSPGLRSVDGLLAAPNAAAGRWGKFAVAIARHESVTRPAPAPTELGPTGNPRLAAPFAEWMMMWPPGWVTDPEIGLTRNEQLHAIGNGVCPPQALAAFRYLLGIAEGVIS